MCVEAAVCFALGLPHGDKPDCVAPSLRALKIRLNDLDWSCNQARAKGLRELALLQLGSKENLDEVEFVKRVAMLVVNKYLPPILRKVNLEVEADACEQAANLADTCTAAVCCCCCCYAAYASAACCCLLLLLLMLLLLLASVCCFCCCFLLLCCCCFCCCSCCFCCCSLLLLLCAAASDAAASDKVLAEFAQDVAAILIDMKVPGVQWLNLI